MHNVPCCAKKGRAANDARCLLTLKKRRHALCDKTSRIEDYPTRRKIIPPHFLSVCGQDPNERLVTSTSTLQSETSLSVS
jgi:hypothetical protein